MAIQIPCPQNFKQDLYQLLVEILRRSLDVSINPAQMNVQLNVTGNDVKVVTPGNGLVVSTRDGLHTYRILVENNGAVTSDQLT